MKALRSAAACSCSAGRRGTAIKALVYDEQGDWRCQKDLQRDSSRIGICQW